MSKHTPRYEITPDREAARGADQEGDSMIVKMTPDEALAIIDSYTRGMTLHADSTGGKVAALVLAEEVRRLRALLEKADATKP